MNKKRDGADNWFMLPFDERAKMMTEHGKVGRSYHGAVTQVISGSIGFDDFEWGVDLYADDPLVFKKLVYDIASPRRARALENLVRFGAAYNFRPPSCGCFSTAMPAGTRRWYVRSTPARAPVGIGHGRVTNPKHAIASAATPPVMKASSVPPRSHNHPASSEPNGPLARKT